MGTIDRQSDRQPTVKEIQLHQHSMHAVGVVITLTERAPQSGSDDGGGDHGAEMQHSLVDKYNQVCGLAASIAW